MTSRVIPLVACAVTPGPTIVSIVVAVVHGATTSRAVSEAVDITNSSTVTGPVLPPMLTTPT